MFKPLKKVKIRCGQEGLRFCYLFVHPYIVYETEVWGISCGETVVSAEEFNEQQLGMSLV